MMLSLCLFVRLSVRLSLFFLMKFGFGESGLVVSTPIHLLGMEWRVGYMTGNIPVSFGLLGDI